ncbi:hypothetical protein ACF09K_22800 [Streptomyces sp. NPDC014882]|uniref:hypothetical protein n=1 Tax=Streptomyces sp. NPDC014882 TaxID=3364927 RepID=UPI0036FB60C8
MTDIVVPGSTRTGPVAHAEKAPPHRETAAGGEFRTIPDGGSARRAVIPAPVLPPSPSPTPARPEALFLPLPQPLPLPLPLTLPLPLQPRLLAAGDRPVPDGHEAAAAVSPSVHRPGASASTPCRPGTEERHTS